MQELDLVQALSAKLCHDLAGSIGALDSCLSLMENNNEEISHKAKNLAYAESSNLVKKIRFYRTAYGLAESETKISIIKMVDLIQGFYKGTNIKFSLKREPRVISLDSAIVKASLCLLLLAGESNVFGGEICLNISDDNLKPIVIKAIGKEIIFKDSSKKVLGDTINDSPITVNNCREHYINAICKSINYELEVTKSDKFLEFSICKKGV